MSLLRSAPHPICSVFGALQRAGGGIFGCVLLAALAGGCGGQSLSTDTGNPPVVVQKLRITATPTGVVVSGDPGAVPPGAYVEVINISNALTTSTEAAEDGSFEVEAIGTASDEYRVYVSTGEESWRTRLTTSGVTTPQSGLDGRAFRLSGVRADSGMQFLPGPPLELSFEAGQLSFNAGCNTYSAPYSLCQGRLCVSALAGTDRGCESERHAQDSWLASFFEASPRVYLGGATIGLGDAVVELELTDREAVYPDKPLAGQIWSINGVIQDWRSSSPDRSIGPFIEFDTDGTFRVFTTCNEGQGTYVHSGQALTLSNVRYTPFLPYVNTGGCPAINAPLDQHLQSVVSDGSLSVGIYSYNLELMRGSSGLYADTDP